jgi:hypothetical protein
MLFGILRRWFRIGKRRSYIKLPRGWSLISSKGLGPFITHETYQRPDGSYAIWRSRHHRKRGARIESAYWAPHRLAWWISILFMLGSALFAIGAALSFSPTVPTNMSSSIFFAGSLFFTSAAYLQFFESINVERSPEPEGNRNKHHYFRIIAWEPDRIDWWSTSTQLVGTILFNFNTFDTFLRGLSAVEQDLVIWTPDTLGSILFLVSSVFACMEVAHALNSWWPRNLSWWIVSVNLMGSIAFGISAMAAFVLPTTDQLFNVFSANLFTFIGGVCFFVGAFLLLPEIKQLDKPRQGFDNNNLAR